MVAYTPYPVRSLSPVHVCINHVCSYCCLCFLPTVSLIFPLGSAHFRQFEEINDTGKQIMHLSSSEILDCWLSPPAGVYVVPEPQHCITASRTNTRTSYFVGIFFAIMRLILGQTMNRLFRTAVWKTAQYRQLSSASGKMSTIKWFLADEMFSGDWET